MRALRVDVGIFVKQDSSDFEMIVQDGNCERGEARFAIDCVPVSAVAKQDRCASLVASAGGSLKGRVVITAVIPDAQAMHKVGVCSVLT